MRAADDFAAIAARLKQIEPTAPRKDEAEPELAPLQPHPPVDYGGYDYGACLDVTDAIRAAFCADLFEAMPKA